jgi:hopanoid-associated phosphorylase
VITGIVVALPEELGTLTSAKITKGNCASIKDNVLVAYSGAGADNAQRAAKLLIDNGADQLISWGCAAAIAVGLKPGDLVLADRILTADHKAIVIDKIWHNTCQSLLAHQLTMHVGQLLESKRLVATSQEKQLLNLASLAIALDMESAAVAQIAQQHQLPFLVLRAIADPVEMDLPSAIGHSLNSAGDVEIGKLLLFLVRHPSETLGLIKLGWHFQAAKNTLKKVATQLDAIVNFNATTPFA